MDYPLGIFYPQFTLYPVALFCILFKNYVAGIFTGIILYTFLTMVFCYFTVRRMGNPGSWAWLTAVIFAFCNYRFIDTYNRFAIGEMIAMTFMPLVIYGLYAVLAGNRRDWPFLGIGMSLMLMSHILTPFITSIWIVVITIFTLPFVHERLKKLGCLVKAEAITVMLSAVVLLPLLEQYSWQAYLPLTDDPSQYALRPKYLLISSLQNSTLDADWGNNTYNIGLIVLVAAAAGLFCLPLLKKRERIIWGMGVFHIFMATKWCPWSLLDRTPLRVVQSPWRYFTLASLMLAYSAGAEIYVVCVKIEGVRSKNARNKICKGQEMAETLSASPGAGDGGRLTAIVSAIVGCVAVGVFLHSYSQYIAVNSTVHTVFTGQHEAFERGEVQQGDYTPADALPYLDEIRGHVAIVDGRKVTLEDDSILADVQDQIYTDPRVCSAEEVDLPAAVYRNLHVLQDQPDGSRTELEITESSRGTVLVHPNGGGWLHLVYIPSALDWISIAVTVAEWLLMGYYALWRSGHVRISDQ